MKWTKEETDYLLNNYKTKSAYEIGDKLKRTNISVSLKARSLGVKCVKKINRWTPHEDQYIMRNLHLTDKELGDYLNRTILSVRARRQRIGIVKNKKLDIRYQAPRLTKGRYYETEEDIEQSLNPKYQIEDLKGWELHEYLNQ